MGVKGARVRACACVVQRARRHLAAGISTARDSLRALWRAHTLLVSAALDCACKRAQFGEKESAFQQGPIRRPDQLSVIG